LCTGSYADGRTPWQRLADNPDIGTCHDNLSVAENLAAFFSTGGAIAIPVERSVYMWMYQTPQVVMILGILVTVRGTLTVTQTVMVLMLHHSRLTLEEIL